MTIEHQRLKVALELAGFEKTIGEDKGSPVSNHIVMAKKGIQGKYFITWDGKLFMGRTFRKAREMQGMARVMLRG